MKRLLGIVALVVVLSLVVPYPAMAMAEPTSVTLYDIEIFQDLIYEGDFLAIVPYNIDFETQPDDDIDETFVFRMMSTDGTEQVGSVLAYPRYYGGYGKGIVSFYFSENTTWESAYIFRVQQNPAYYPTPQYWDFQVGASDYSSGDDQAAELRARILDVATELGNEWDVDLKSTSDTGVVLSTYGELYFIDAIPAIQTMCPQLFQIRIVSPTYTKRSWTYTLAEAMRTKYDGTVIGDFMTGYAGLFSMETNLAMNVLSVIIFAAVIVLSTWKFKGNTMSAFMDGYAVLILLMLNGFISMILVGLMAFLSGAVGAVVLFLNKS